MSGKNRLCFGGLLALGITAAACGNSGTDFICGTGTHANADNICVPDEVQQDAAPAQQDAQHDSAPPKVKGEIGSACTTDADCVDGTCATTALDPRLVGGYCTKIGCCVGEGCSAQIPCPTGSVCFDTGKGFNSCFRYCDPGADICREGYVCQPAYATDPAVAFCAPQCSTDADCPAGSPCETTAGMCVPPSECDPTASPSDCATGSTCFPTDTSTAGGFCLTDCTARADCKSGEVCQPLAIGSTAGVCMPPPCTANADCPAGAVCADQATGLKYCKTPDVCDTNTPCPNTTDFSCTPSGICMSNCTDDADCTAIHPGLVCATALGGVCLPIGAFPSGPCKADHTCDDLTVGSTTFEQVCVGGVCAIPCPSGQDSFCAPLGLTCESAVSGLCTKPCDGAGACDTGYSCFEKTGSKPGAQNACLPTGAFPSSPCRGASDPKGKCDVNLSKNGAQFDLGCFDDGSSTGVCLIQCAADTLCSTISSGLACYEEFSATLGGACFPHCTSHVQCGYTSWASNYGMACLATEQVCLPLTAFPSSPCRSPSTEVCKPVGGVLAQVCVGDSDSLGVDGQCLVKCTPGHATQGDALCRGVNAALKCMPNSESTGTAPSGGVCVPGCIGGSCAAVGANYTCEPNYQVCLPTGAFPGSPCLPPDGSHSQYWCANVAPGVTMSCSANSAAGLCAPDCDDAAGGNALCQAINPALTCMPHPGGTTGSCTYACVSGQCPTGFSCYDAGGQNACLPTGSFPGSPCGAGSTCANPLIPGMACDPCSNACVIPAGSQTVCDAYGLKWAGAIGKNICVKDCSSVVCSDNRYFCFAANYCLPKGAVPGQQCSAANTCGRLCASSGFSEQMLCESTVCMVPCTGNTDCTALGAGTTCGTPVANRCGP